MKNFEKENAEILQILRSIIEEKAQCRKEEVDSCGLTDMVLENFTQFKEMCIELRVLDRVRRDLKQMSEKKALDRITARLDCYPSSGWLNETGRMNEKCDEKIKQFLLTRKYK